jgi:two-component system, OmpR family, sensor kinase
MPERRSSLTRRILVPVAWVLVAAGLASAAVAFYLARNEANELLDYQLKQLTHVVATERIPASASALPPNDRDSDVEDDFVVLVWDLDGQLIQRTPGAPSIAHPAPGFSSVSSGETRWRVYSETRHQRQVAVAQRLDLRTELAGAGALQALLPVLALVPLLGAVIGWIVLRSLRPLRAVSAEVEQRAATDLRPLPEENLPDDVRPLLGAMNGLLARLDEAMTQQKRFVADAAHELRTPLGALQIKAEMLENANDEDERRNRTRALRAGITRLSGLVSQLLTMARLEASADEAPVKLDLLEIVKSVVADLYPVAEARDINLGLTESESVSVRGHPAGLRALFANLIDNALRHTPRGGQVDISVRRFDHSVIVSVTDSGPGIPEADLARVFDRFFRGDASGATGHGLGLAIARAAAEQHHARIALENRSDTPGLRASVTFEL